MKNENIIYLVLSNLNHDGTHFQKGAFIEGDYSPTFITLVRDGIIKEVLGASTFAEAKKIVETEEVNTPEVIEEVKEPENTWGGRPDDKDDVITPTPEEYKGALVKVSFIKDYPVVDEKNELTGNIIATGTEAEVPEETVAYLFENGFIAEIKKGEEVVTPENTSPEVTGENL